MSFDILNSTERITAKYIQYLNTMFDIDDPDYRKLFKNQMKETGSFAKGPYLDVVDSFETGSSVKDLMETGMLNRDFQRMPDISSKTLYRHQETALKKLSAGKNIVISTGTGSGKTESFLIPVLNSILDEKKEKGKLEPGVRALLIYPMNALANDQIERLRSLLKDCPEITFGAYTGQTLEEEDKALEKYKSLHRNEKPLKNELISREQMQETPPHILITNYSMLEYLMLRPRDNSFFQGKYSHNWRYVVLDEAHIYSGSTGIEVSMLLRRLKAYLNDCEIRFILTSATLGGEKANDEVAEFAKNLCDAPFSGEDVVRASRVKLSQDQEGSVTLPTETYLKWNDILQSCMPDDAVLELLKQDVPARDDVRDLGVYLFRTLLKDSTFWRVKNYLAKPKTVSELCAALEWSRAEVSAFVNVASHAVSNRKKLFDARYHMFLRAADGVYITLGKEKDLSLTRQTKKNTGQTEYRYFEIVTCGQCHAIYLIGNIETEDGKTYLRQRSNRSGEGIREAFLLGEAAGDEDDDFRLEDENLKVKNYELCPHCGFIRERNRVHPVKCEHSENGYIALTKVSQSERTGRVTKCIRCEGVNNLGILRSFFSGQEASTSVIGTALFEELPDKEAFIEMPAEQFDDLDDGFSFEDEDMTPEQNLSYRRRAKQFIAFSDNRQAAAFFATYFYETYQGFLYSRIVYENIQKTDENGKPVGMFAKDMSMDFRKHGVSEMFDENPDYLKEAWKAIMKELLGSYSRNSLTGLGLMKLDLSDSIHVPKNDRFHLSAEEIRNMVLVFCRDLFECNAIAHGQNFTQSDIDFYTNNGEESYFVLTGADSKKKYIKSFIPKSDSSTNKRMNYLERVFESKGIPVDRDRMMNFMKGLWTWMQNSKLLRDDSRYTGKQLDPNCFRIVNTRKWYRCSKCKRLTPYNVENICPAYKCDGTLEEANLSGLEDNHYYRIFHDLEIEPMRVVEHTAQLTSEEAYRLQERFKRREIDVLSCSTTFEMGVDIGDLETVFMRNMPPTPSNYVQRAGRAGRSTKSAALALTFCNKANHDFSYFANPTSMISGEIRPPVFKVENEKIGIRHLYSAAFSFFWRRYPEFFGEISKFFGNEEDGEGFALLGEYLTSGPEDLKEYLKDALPAPLTRKLEVDSFGWVRWLMEEPDENNYPSLKNAHSQYRSDIDSLYREKKELEAQNRSNYTVVKRINTFTKENIITYLSRSTILPKYGFPVDTVELKVTDEKTASPLPVDLSRDLAMAISEYAPGCEIIAAGKMIRSRYIRKMPDRGWREYDYVSCPECKTLNIALHHEALSSQPIPKCAQCGQLFSSGRTDTFLVPEFGFQAESEIRTPSLIKPERTYRSDASMVSRGKEAEEKQYRIGGLLVSAISMEDGEIAVLNKSDFYVCPVCGFGLGGFETQSYSGSASKEHKNPSGYRCRNKILRKYSLGYQFKTDALRISVSRRFSYEEAYSVLQAIVLSACNLLNIDHYEIAGCLQYSEKDFGNTYDFIIYDTTPGGAGHVRRFNSMETMDKVLKGAYQKARNCDCGGEEGDSSCYKCLRTYQNQQNHDMIKRRYVINGLKGLFEEPAGTVPAAKSRKPEQKKIVSLKLSDLYCDISMENYDYIYSGLDLEDDGMERELSRRMREAAAPKPDGMDVDFRMADGRKGYADLIWKDRKVMLFRPDNMDSFAAAADGGYTCFLLDSQLDIEKLISTIK